MEKRVELVHCTPDAEMLIVKMARVSNPRNAENRETVPRLLRYLLKHKHVSPFEMASMCLKIETERDISAQIIRHRSFSFQELSTRYTKTAPAELPALRRQDDKNRQNSIDDLPAELIKHHQGQMAAVVAAAYKAYEEMLEAGVAKECARRVLPLCTPTTLYINGTLRSWIHYLEVRCGEETQLEHRLIAQECKQIFCQQFPVIGEAAFKEEA